MAAKPALHLEPAYRSGLEVKMGEQLTAAGIEFDFEKMKLPYEVPAREAKYIPDFPIRHTKIILEGKGIFGHMGRGGAQERQKMVLVKAQHPEWDIRFVFSNASKPIYKGSKTTYGKWADDHGFPWATKGVIPKAWLDEMKTAARCRKTK